MQDPTKVINIAATLLECSDVVIVRDDVMLLQHVYVATRIVVLIMFAPGVGVLAQSPDTAPAELWTRAEQGDAGAQNDLGLAYALGEMGGVLQDYTEAAHWFRLAAEQGHAEAQFNLGFAFASGEGIPQNDIESDRWFRRAAEQGHVGAQFTLGLGFADRLGDPLEASRWFQRAAEQGHPGAQFYLGQSYAVGAGVARDDVAAYMWLNLATAYSTGEAQVRAVNTLNAVAARMSDEQVAEAQRRTLEWVGGRSR